MFGLGLPEIAIILVVALLVLGPKRLPDAARSLGRSLAEFRRASNEIRNSLVLEAPPERSESSLSGSASTSPRPPTDTGSPSSRTSEPERLGPSEPDTSAGAPSPSEADKLPK